MQRLAAKGDNSNSGSSERTAVTNLGPTLGTKIGDDMYQTLRPNRSKLIADLTLTSSPAAAKNEGSSGGAPQLADKDTLNVNLGCFNTGLDQSMLTKHKHQCSLKRVIGKAFDEAGLHAAAFCEVGGHKRGFAETTVNPQDLLQEVLSTNAYEAAAKQAYLTLWQTSDAPELGGVCLTPSGEAEVVQLTSTTLDPQLLIRTFEVTANSFPGKVAYLVLGQLHIRTPHDQRPPTEATKKRITRNALDSLQERRGNLCSASQPARPVVLVLAGDVNLGKAACDTIVQKDEGTPNPREDWHVQAANAGKSGDVAFVNGTHSTVIDVSIGTSYTDKGIRNDCHDFFALSLAIPMADSGASQHSGARDSGAPQPAQETDGRAAEKAAAEAKKHQTEEEGTSGAKEDDKKDKQEEKAESARGQKREHESGQSGSAQPATTRKIEKRYAPNNRAYTKDEFFDYWADPNEAQQQWDDAKTTPPQTGPRNCLNHGVADAIVQHMRAWFELHSDEEPSVLWRHLQQTLFKNVTVPLEGDFWYDEDDENEDDQQHGFKMVISKEYVASQVYHTIEHRNIWLQSQGLPQDTVMRDKVADAFLTDKKKQFHALDYQQRRQAADALTCTRDRCNKRKHSRWSRHTQKLGGTSQMWTLLSFTGRFSPEFFATLKVDPKSNPGERSLEQKQRVRDAVEARGNHRLGRKYDLKRSRIDQGEAADDEELTSKQLALLEVFDSGFLLKEANRLTKLAGHGRIHKSRTEWIDIGGSTGGFVRTVLDDWAPPDLSDV